MREKFLKLVTENGKISRVRLSEKYLRKYGFYDFINKSFGDSYTFKEKVYCIINNIKSKPLCKTCGKELIFPVSGKYPTYCSRKCSNADPEVLLKNKAGVTKGLLKAYAERGDSIKEKRANTIEQNFGVKTSSPFGVPKIQEEILETLLERHNVTNAYQMQKCKDASRVSRRDKSIEKCKLKGYDIEFLDVHKILVKNMCPIHHDVEIDSRTFYNRAFKHRHGVECVICNPLNNFTSLETHFENLLNEMFITTAYSKHDRSIISPLELDFYFKDKKIAFELNGVYWHSELNISDNNYHKNKSDLCENLGIELMHIWEDDFYTKKEIIKSMVCEKLNTNLTLIDAKDCVVRAIETQEYKNFLKINHILGEINSSIRYGLFCNDVLVSVIGFCKLKTPHKNKNNNYELQRFCTKLFTKIDDALEILYNYFEKNNEFDEVLVTLKRDHSNGNDFKKIGFELSEVSKPELFWVIDGDRNNRFNFRKKDFQEESRFKCYDSGNLKFVKQRLSTASAVKS